MEIPTTVELLAAAPKPYIQLILWFANTLFWYVILDFIAAPLFITFINKMKSRAHFIKIHRETNKKDYDWDFSDDNEAVSVIAYTYTCTIQHLIGGICCLISGYGFSPLLPTGIAHALARHGNLSELGWETKDTLLRVYEMLFGGVVGRRKNPFKFILMMGIHHTSALCMVIPINLYYPDDTYFHELSGILQLSAGIMFILMNYGYTCDVTKASELLKMKISVTLSYIIITWARFVRYFWLLMIIGERIIADGNWGVFILACIPGFFLSIFNMILVVNGTGKFIKLKRAKKDSKK